MIPLPLACIADNDVRQDLGHQSVIRDICHTVPGIGVLWVYQVKYLHLIPILAKQFRTVVIQLALWV